LNESKTEVIVFGPHDNYDSNNIDLDYLDPKSSCIKNLGVLWDQNLKFEKQIITVISACFFQLRLLLKIKSSLFEKTLEIAIHALITSRLDYCNSLYLAYPNIPLLVSNRHRTLLQSSSKENADLIIFHLS